MVSEHPGRSRSVTKFGTKRAVGLLLEVSQLLMYWFRASILAEQLFRFRLSS